MIGILDRNKFSHIIRKHDGDRYMKHSTCWNQPLSLMFRQLSNRESLRDLIVTLDAYHSNVIIREWIGNVPRSSLARANPSLRSTLTNW